MRIVICEDQLLYQKSIDSKIEKWMKNTKYVDVSKCYFSSSEDFLEQWEKGLSADIIFLDILFSHEMDGMSLAKKIRETDQSILIVFITNSEAYVKEGYAVHAFRYLNKPVCYDDIAHCLDVAHRQHIIAHNKYLILTSGGQRIALRYETILYLEARSPYTHIHTCEGQEDLQVRCRLSELMPKLPEEQFALCHRSYIVNIIHVRKIRRKELTLSNGETLPISRPCLAMVNAVFDRYYQEGGGFIHVGSL